MGNTITIPVSQLQDPIAAPSPQSTTASTTGQQGTITVPPSQLQDPITPTQQATAMRQTQPPTFLQKVKAGILESMPGQLLSVIGGPPQDVDEVAAHAGGGETGLVAYRAAKALLQSHDAMQKAKGDAFYNAVDNFRNAAIDFITGSNYDAMMHTASGTLNAVGATDANLTGPTSEAADIAEGATTGKNLVTPLTRGIVDLGTLAATAAGPKIFGTEAAAGEEAAAVEPATAATEETALAPKAQAVAQGTAKAGAAGVSEGTAETVAPTGEDIQPQLHQGIRSFINQTASDAGLDPVPDSVPITDAPQELADAFQTRSQATFDKVEEITGIDPTALKQQMAERADQITEAAASGDLEKAGKLEMLQKADENRGIQAFNTAKAQGVDVDQARTDWNQSLRGDELSAAVRGSKANTSTLANPVLDPAKLAPRLQKLAESRPGGKAPKLFQLGGEDNATALVEHAENARDATQAIKDFVPQSATGQKLFSQILSNNTIEKSGGILRGGKVVAGTDWNGVVKDLGNLSPAQQTALGSDLARMRQVAGKQALKQNAAHVILGKSPLGYVARGAVAEEVARRTF